MTSRDSTSSEGRCEADMRDTIQSAFQNSTRTVRRCPCKMFGQFLPKLHLHRALCGGAAEQDTLHWRRVAQCMLSTINIIYINFIIIILLLVFITLPRCCDIVAGTGVASSEVHGFVYVCWQVETFQLRPLALTPPPPPGAHIRLVHYYYYYYYYYCTSWLLYHY